jgi:hypothetical protein
MPSGVGQRSALPLYRNNPVPKAEALTEVVTAPKVDLGVTEADMVRTKNSTKASLDAMPKAFIRLPKAGKNDPNFETVQINGYTYQIMRGQDVEVPQLVKDILVEAELI